MSFPEKASAFRAQLQRKLIAVPLESLAIDQSSLEAGSRAHCSSSRCLRFSFRESELWWPISFLHLGPVGRAHEGSARAHDASSLRNAACGRRRLDPGDHLRRADPRRDFPIKPGRHSLQALRPRGPAQRGARFWVAMVLAVAAIYEATEVIATMG
jgi:hypothetical protein